MFPLKRELGGFDAYNLWDGLQDKINKNGEDILPFEYATWDKKMTNELRTQLDNKQADLLEHFKGEFGRRKFTFLLIGRTGVGKSSTINSLLGVNVSEVGEFQAATKHIERFDATIHGIPFTVIDTPGLTEDDLELTDFNYLDEIKSQVQQIDCLWYVTPLSETRIRSDELKSLKLVSQTFGADVWNRTIIVFTFADMIPAEVYQHFLAQRTKLIRSEIAKFIGLLAAKGISFVTVANGAKGTLARPDGSLWLSELFTKVIETVSNESAIPFFLGTKPRVLAESMIDPDKLEATAQNNDKQEGTDISFDNAFDFVLNELRVIYEQTRQQSHSWFRFSLAAAVVGFVTFVTGIFFVLTGQGTLGMITLLSSVIPSVTAALFFTQSKTANERIDKVGAKLGEAQELQTAVKIANTIVDLKAQDKLKAEIVKKILRMDRILKQN